MASIRSAFHPVHPPVTVIHSPYPPDECLRRIEASLDGHLGLLGVTRSSRPGLLGRIEGDRVTLSVKLRTGWQQRRVYARWVGSVLPDGARSMLVGEANEESISSFEAIWLAAGTFILVTLVVLAGVASLTDPPQLLRALPIAVVLLAMLAAGAVFFDRARQGQAFDRAEIENRLREAIERRDGAG